MDIYPELLRRLSSAEFSRSHRSNHEVEDLAQETAYRFLAQCRKGPAIPDDPLAYSVRIAQNLVRSRFSAKDKLPLDYTDDDLSDQYAYDPRSEHDEDEDYSEYEIECVRQAIETLPKKQRQVFDLVNANPGARTVDLAQEIGLTSDAFRMNAKRAFDTVRRSARSRNEE